MNSCYRYLSVILENNFHNSQLYFFAEYCNHLLFSQTTVCDYIIFQKKYKNRYSNVEATDKCLSLSVNQLLTFAVYIVKLLIRLAGPFLSLRPKMRVLLEIASFYLLNLTIIAGLIRIRVLLESEPH